MGMSLVDLTEHLIPISDFSQGKAGKIFNDVAKNDSEYIVLKNNQPTAVVISINEYKEIQEKLNRLEKLLEIFDNMKLLKVARERDDSNASSFEDFVKEQGYSMEELEKLSESVDIE